jgi:hypothetical protein
MSESRTELQTDLAAYFPSEGKPILFAGKKYLVPNFGDLKIDDALRLLKAEEELLGKGLLDQLELTAEYVAILIPQMDRETIGSMTQNQAVVIYRMALGLAEFPPMADAAPSDSGTVSPLSAVSTDGPGATSGS